MDLHSLPFTIADLRRLYLDNAVSVEEVMEEALRRAARSVAHPHVWIRLLTSGEVARYVAALDPARKGELPLYGIPFAIKDNIDLAHIPTTCACPAFAYTPEKSATVVELLIAAGAIPIGKTNLDQFATGLVGVRTPYGACQSVFDARYVSGGSSSGSGVAVAAGMVAFALGTDTAGSGRVPAAFNNIVGLKPSKGIFSTTGLYPACRALDCISVFSATCADAETVMRVAARFDETDAYSRELTDLKLPEKCRVGIPCPEHLHFFGDEQAAELYAQAVARIEELGCQRVDINFEPFAKAAALLYAGPWVAERRAALGDFMTKSAAEMDPTVRGIVEKADGMTAVQAFEGAYALQALAAAAAREWKKMDVMLLPTTGTTYTIEQLRAEPVKYNTNLGYYTNFVNLLDLSAVAVPAGFRSTNGLPFGVTLMAPAFGDASLLALGDRLHRALAPKVGSPSVGIDLAKQPSPVGPIAESSASAAAGSGTISVAVVGAHLEGQPLNHQLTSKGGKLLGLTRTSPRYRLYALANTRPAKPGLRRMDDPVEPAAPGAEPGIEVEVWTLPLAAFGAFMLEVGPPLGIGSLELADGTWVKGFICEPAALDGAEDITEFGGWRNFLRAAAEAKG
ncbi:allophanate hydrolase [Verrucomicrobia bacterium LW23]|nr:allophanate hydrolase [Verrucomicrobia bacterium LW23]